MSEIIDFFADVPLVFRTSILLGGIVLFWALEGIIPLYLVRSGLILIDIPWYAIHRLILIPIAAIFFIFQLLLIFLFIQTPGKFWRLSLLIENSESVSIIKFSSLFTYHLTSVFLLFRFKIKYTTLCPGPCQVH